MAAASDPLPDDDNDALKAALIEARAKLSGAEAMIEHLQLVIAKMKARCSARGPSAASGSSTRWNWQLGGTGCRARRGRRHDGGSGHRGSGLHASQGDGAGLSR
jgi:hypothetical protein